MKIATRSSWKTLPFPAEKDRIDLTLLYSDAEGERIRLGYIPQDMDDKWFIFFENGWLYFYRSWTGACIFGIHLEGSPNGIRVVDAWVSGDKEHYRSPSPEHDARLIEQLISSLLLS